MSRSLRSLRSAAPRAGVLVAALALGLSTAHAANFNFSAGFPGSNFGPPNAWTYLERDANQVPPVDTAIGHQTMAPYTGAGCALSSPCWQPVWDDPTQPNDVPQFRSNNSSFTTQSSGGCCGVITFPAKCLIVHPGRALQAVVRFTVPAKPNGGSYSQAYLKGTVGDQDYNGGNGVDWSVYHGITLLYGGSLQSTSATSIASAAFPSTVFPVQTGDVIDVVVDASHGDENFDTTSVCGHITLS